MLPKYYQRRLLAAVVGLIIALLSFVRLLCRDIPDEELDAYTLALYQHSAFNPRSSSFCIYSYIHGLSAGNYYVQKPSMAPIGNREGIYFHWDDWVDLSPADSMLAPYRENHPDGAADDRLRHYASVNPYFMESFRTKVLRSMANLYSVKPPPRQIWAALDSGFIAVPVASHKKIHHSMLHKQIPKLAVVLEMRRCDAMGNDSLAPPFQLHPYRPMRKTVEIAPEDFEFDVNATITALRLQLTKNANTADDTRYLQFLEKANADVDSADRFFKYPWIYTDIVAGRAHHTSFPFFKRYVSNRERHSVLHHMVRVWFQFAEANGVDSWINYGSLLGWAYNGLNMPWDTDIDVQMPIAQLDRLARLANSTLVVENPRHGNAKYLFEVSPAYIRQGNGRNFIDARFIDVNTGLYIDISGVAHTADAPPKSQAKNAATMVHCKNWNWHSLEELLPIRHSYFEGASVYIPNNTLSILHQKYGPGLFTTKLEFNGHDYNKQLSLWVPQKECGKRCTGRVKRWTQEQNCFEGNSLVEDEFMISAALALRHRLLNENIDHPRDYEVEDYEDLPIARKDLWEYFTDLKYRVTTSTGWFVGH